MRSRSDSDPTRIPTSGTDVLAELHSGEIYACDARVRRGTRVGDRGASADDVEDAAAVRDEARILDRRARVEDDCALGLRVGHSLDRRARLAAPRITAPPEGAR